MIEVQIGTRVTPTTKLAGVVIPEIDVVARKPDVPLGNAVVGLEQYDTGNADKLIDETDRLVVGRYRKCAPALKIERLKLPVNNPRQSLVKED